MSRRGLSLLEVCVAIAIVGALLTLLLAGIQAARETARRYQCISNLRQIGLALQQYHTHFNRFPLGGGFSYLYHALPYIDHGNFVPLADPFKAYPVSLFQCPSDSSPDAVNLGGILAGANYVGNSGTWQLQHGFDGVFTYSSHVCAGEITDGLSNTAMASEFLRANRSYDRYRVNWNTPRAFSENEIDAFDVYCRSLPDRPALFGWKGDVFAHGTPWALGTVGFTLYNHVSTPGSPSCYNRSSVTDAAIAPVSLHTRCVNVLFSDGHVDSIANQIDKSIWRSFGSRTGGSSE